MSINEIKIQLAKKHIVVNDEIIYAIMDTIHEIELKKLYESSIKDGEEKIPEDS